MPYPWRINGDYQALTNWDDPPSMRVALQYINSFTWKQTIYSLYIPKVLRK